MNNNKGFTIIEMIVGGAILVIVLMIAMSFFIYQSRHGGQLVKETGVREAVTSTFNMIKRDVMQAGAGLVNLEVGDKARSSLSLFLYDKDDTTDPGNPFYKEIYMSYGAYLSMPSVAEIMSTGLRKNTDYVATNFDTSVTPPRLLNPVYYAYGSEAKKNGAIFLGSLGAQFRIVAFPQDIGWVLTYQEAAAQRVNAVPVTGVYDTASHTTLFTINPAPNAATVYAPAIGYELITKDTIPAPVPALADPEFPELRRNGLTILGGVKERTMKLTGFRIRCQFIDNTGKSTWVPDPATGTSFDNQVDNGFFDNLRLVEVQIRYRTSKHREAQGAPTATDKEQGWSQEVVKTVNVSPRDVLLAAY